MTDTFDGPGGLQRDRWGRPLLPMPDDVTGKRVPWTRATTWAKSVDDMTALTKWQLRMVAKGVATRPDLYALAAATPLTDKQTFDKLAESAKEAAAASAGANLGTAVHSFAEQVDRGETPTVPAPWDADIAVYRATLAAAGITVLPEYIERTVVVPDLTVAGTLDRVLRLPDGRLVIGDLKTGQELSYSWSSIAIQLACYSRGVAMWDLRTETYGPAPQVDQDRAVVVHLPSGKARCELHEVDIASGWQAAQLCGDVRRWRTRKDLARPLPVDAPPVDQVLAAIGAAATVDDLNQVWIAHHTRWTPTHTTAAAARKTELAGATP